MHTLGPSVKVVGALPVGVNLAGVLYGLRFAAQQCPGAIQLQPGGQVCRGLLSRLAELVGDMDDSGLFKVVEFVADLHWVPGANVCCDLNLKNSHLVADKC